MAFASGDLSQVALLRERDDRRQPVADPTLAARYHRLMVHQGKHHNSALCHISTTLLTRIIACWRAGTPYQIRDTDGKLCPAARAVDGVDDRQLQRAGRTVTDWPGAGQT